MVEEAGHLVLLEHTGGRTVCRNCGREAEYSIRELAYVHARKRKPLPVHSRRASIQKVPVGNVPKRYVTNDRGEVVPNTSEARAASLPTRGRRLPRGRR